MNNVDQCKCCQLSLTGDDKALNMKLISRNVTEFLCMNCLAVKLGCTRQTLEDRVRYYRESGNCTLFR